jgi:hypothetical protein
VTKSDCVYPSTAMPPRPFPVRVMAKGESNRWSSALPLSSQYSFLIASANLAKRRLELLRSRGECHLLSRTFRFAPS